MKHELILHTGPLGPAKRPEKVDQSEVWTPHSTNPDLEVGPGGRLRTRDMTPPPEPIDWSKIVTGIVPAAPYFVEEDEEPPEPIIRLYYQTGQELLPEPIIRVYYSTGQELLRMRLKKADALWAALEPVTEIKVQG